MFSDTGSSRPCSPESNRSVSAGVPSSDDQGSGAKATAPLGGRPLKKINGEDVLPKQVDLESASLKSDQSSLADSYKIEGSFVLPSWLRADTPEDSPHSHRENISEAEASQLPENKEVFLAPPRTMVCEDDARFVYLTGRDKPLHHSDFEDLVNIAVDTSHPAPEALPTETASPLTQDVTSSDQEASTDERPPLLPAGEPELISVRSSVHSHDHSPAEDQGSQHTAPEPRSVASIDSLPEARALTPVTEKTEAITSSSEHKKERRKYSSADIIAFKGRSLQEWEEVIDLLVIEKGNSLKTLGQEPVNAKKPEHQRYLHILCRFISPRTCAVILACLGGKTSGPMTSGVERANALLEYLEVRSTNSAPISFRELFTTMLKTLWASYEPEQEFPKLQLALSNIAHACHYTDESNPARNKLARLRAQKRALGQRPAMPHST